jgi:hypothetical protein
MRNGAQTIFYGCTEEISKELRNYKVIISFKVPILSSLLHYKQREIDITYCLSGFAK